MTANLAILEKDSELDELQAQASNCLDIKVQINTLQEVLDDFSVILRERVEARGNEGFTIIVPGKGKVIARAAVREGIVGPELKVNTDVFSKLPDKKQRELIRMGLLTWVDKVRPARAAAISYQPNV